MTLNILQALCTIVAVLLHYIFLVVFCLMLAEGFQLFLHVTVVFSKESHLRKQIAVAWGKCVFFFFSILTELYARVEKELNKDILLS